MYRAAAILATALIIGTGTQTPSAAAAGRDTGLVSTDYLIVTATVDAVDQERRLVTIKDPDGKTVPLRASKKVKDFEKLEKGKQVTAEYLEAVAVIVRKPDGKSDPGFLRDVTVAPHGKDSAGLPVDTVDALGMVEAVDHDKRTITFKGANGIVHTYKVDERVKKFRYILKGDKVFVRVTEPLAVRIRLIEQ
jgi:hypothetical protein